MEQLLEIKNVSQLLLRLLSTMKKKNRHKELSEEADLVLSVLASLISYFRTGKRRPTSVNLIMVIHGMAISNELIDMFHKCGMCICYNYLLLLYATRPLQDAENRMKNKLTMIQQQLKMLPSAKRIECEEQRTHKCATIYISSRSWY